MFKTPKWRTAIFKAPMIVGHPVITIKEENEHRLKCRQEKTPYAEFANFSSRKKYGTYICDLCPILDEYQLPDNALTELSGAISAFLARWTMDKRINKKTGINYSLTNDRIQIFNCPFGEEQYVHLTVCHILSQRMEVKA